MYFNNRQTARENENILAKAVHKAKTFDEHQATTAMFLMTMVTRFEHKDTGGWVQNELQGITCPRTRVGRTDLANILEAVERTLEGCGPQTAAGNAFILVDDDLRKDIRFELCPVGSVAMFKGVLDTNRWGLQSGIAKQAALAGWFISPAEFVVHDPVLAGSYLLGQTRWHGGENVVGHLRVKGEYLKLMNRPLSESYALAETYHDAPGDVRTLWLHQGMRFELMPANGPVSRILTPPSDTQPQRSVVARHGATRYVAELIAPAVSILTTAWSMTDLPSVMHEDTHYAGGVVGASSVLSAMLAHSTEACMDGPALTRELSARGCRLAGNAGFIGGDGVVYEFGNFLHRHSWKFSRADAIAPGQYGRVDSINLHWAYALSVLALIVKYGLPREMFLGLYMRIRPTTSGSAAGNAAMLCKLRTLPSTDVDVMASLEHLDRSTPIFRLCTDVFAESRIARSRATYHAGLTQSARKKVLAKFYPTM